MTKNRETPCFILRESLLRQIEKNVPSRFLEPNLAAFQAGLTLGEKSRSAE